jgi:hypothetical protein
MTIPSLIMCEKIFSLRFNFFYHCLLNGIILYQLNFFIFLSFQFLLLFYLLIFINNFNFICIRFSNWLNTRVQVRRYLTFLKNRRFIMLFLLLINHLSHTSTEDRTRSQFRAHLKSWKLHFVQ